MPSGCMNLPDTVIDTYFCVGQHWFRGNKRRTCLSNASVDVIEALPHQDILPLAGWYVDVHIWKTCLQMGVPPAMIRMQMRVDDGMKGCVAQREMEQLLQLLGMCTVTRVNECRVRP